MSGSYAVNCEGQPIGVPSFPPPLMSEWFGWPGRDPNPKLILGFAWERALLRLCYSTLWRNAMGLDKYDSCRIMTFVSSRLNAGSASGRFPFFCRRTRRRRRSSCGHGSRAARLRRASLASVLREVANRAAPSARQTADYCGEKLVWRQSRVRIGEVRDAPTLSPTTNSNRSVGYWPSRVVDAIVDSDSTPLKEFRSCSLEVVSWLQFAL